jgi:ParB family chromosome partitioning protein
MNKKSGLGRGLSALLENAETDVTSNKYNQTVGSIAEIEIENIEVNPFQPRTHFEQEALEELSLSIAEHGIIQPVTVRKIGNNKFQLISGERRFRASQLAGLTKIPAYIRVANDESMLEMAIIENIHRQNLNAIEVAQSFNRLIEECKLTHEELSQKVAKNRSTVTNYLRLLKLPVDIQIAIRDEKISMGHARSIAALESPEAQIQLFKEIILDSYSVRKSEERAAELKLLREKAKKKNSSIVSNDYLQNQLKQVLKAKVNVRVGENGSGKIVISFKTKEELERIAQILQA